VALSPERFELKFSGNPGRPILRSLNPKRKAAYQVGGLKGLEGLDFPTNPTGATLTSKEINDG